MGLSKEWKWVLILFVIILVVVIGGTLISSQIGLYEEELDPNATVLAKGSLESTTDSSRRCNGNVRLVQATDGKLYFYFIDVGIDQGFNEFIYLSDQINLKRSTDNPGNTVEIGAMTHYSGTFSISIPDTVDPLQYKTLIIFNKASNKFFFKAELK